MENKPEFPFNSNEICACCGSEYGVDIQDHSDIQQLRNEWLNEGADWFDDEEDVKPRKPNDWNLQAAEQQIFEAFGESNEIILEFIQKQALILVQALLGVISNNFRMISIKEVSGKVIVTIILETEKYEDLEEIEDLQSEFEALQEAPVDYEFVTQINNEELDWPDENIIVIFRRREF